MADNGTTTERDAEMYARATAPEQSWPWFWTPRSVWDEMPDEVDA